LLLIVLTLQRVHRIVEPQRQLDLARVLRKLHGGLMFVQALLEVLEGVVFAMRLVVAGDKSLKQTCCGLRLQPGPGSLPGLMEVVH
jgi:hypothetical protein